MLLEINAHYFCPIKEESMDIIKDICIFNFYEKLVQLTQESLDCTTKNYYSFDKLGKRIKINSKNIVFETLITDELKMGKINLSESAYCCCGEKRPTKVSYKSQLEFWQKDLFEYFSCGEFPYMTIYIARLGNTDHFFYTISR